MGNKEQRFSSIKNALSCLQSDLVNWLKESWFMISKRTNKSQFKALRMHSLNKLHQEIQLKQLLRKFETFPTWWKHSNIEMLLLSFFLLFFYFLFFFNMNHWFYLHKIFTSVFVQWKQSLLLLYLTGVGLADCLVSTEGQICHYISTRRPQKGESFCEMSDEALSVVWSAPSGLN